MAKDKTNYLVIRVPDRTGAIREKLERLAEGERRTLGGMVGELIVREGQRVSKKAYQRGSQVG